MISRQYEIELKESLLALIEIESSFKYELEEETSIGFISLLYIFLSFILLSQSSTLIDFLLSII